MGGRLFKEVHRDKGLDDNPMVSLNHVYPLVLSHSQLPCYIGDDTALYSPEEFAPSFPHLFEAIGITFFEFLVKVGVWEDFGWKMLV